MKQRLVSRTLGMLLIPALCLALAACGDSGGGGYSIPAGYTGSTDPAVITPSNAEALVLDAYEGGSQSSDLMVVPLSADATPADPSVRAVTDLLAGIAVNLPVTPQVSPLATEPPVTGSCGGSYTVTINQSGNSASGSIVFSAYCEGDVTLNGSISFAGSADNNGNVTMSMTIGSISATSIDGSFTMSGTFRVSFNANTENGSMAMRMVFTDGATSETMFVDYTVAVTVGPDVAPADGWPDYEDVRVSGRFYSHFEGYLVVSTVTPLRTLDGDFDPSSGKLRFDGANGTWATYEITGIGTYEIVYFDGINTVTIPSP